MLHLLDASPLLPITAALVLSVLILSSRAFSFGAAAWSDPLTPGPRVWRTLEAAALGYVWIALGWLLQLHAFYLELSSAPRTWLGTTKQTSPAALPIEPHA